MRTFAIAFAILLLATLAPAPTASAACSTQSVNTQVARVYVTSGDETSCTDVTAYRCQPRVDPIGGGVHWVCMAVASTPPVPNPPAVCESQWAGGVPLKVYLAVGSDPDCIGASVDRCTYFYDLESNQLLMTCSHLVSVP